LRTSVLFGMFVGTESVVLLPPLWPRFGRLSCSLTATFCCPVGTDFGGSFTCQINYNSCKQASKLSETSTSFRCRARSWKHVCTPLFRWRHCWRRLLLKRRIRHVPILIAHSKRFVPRRATTSVLIPGAVLSEGPLTGDVFVARPVRGVTLAGEPESQLPGSESSTQSPVVHNTMLPGGSCSAAVKATESVAARCGYSALCAVRRDSRA